MSTACLVFLMLVAQSGPQAKEAAAKEQARVLLKQGAQYYEQGAFADALDRFERAYAVFPSPKLFFNIGQANRELGRAAAAVTAFNRFLAQAPEVSPALAAEAKRSLEELGPTVGKLLIACSVAGATILVDGRIVGRSPLPDFVFVSPGRHQVTAVHPKAAPDPRMVDVAAGTVEAVALQPPSRRPASAAPPPGSPGQASSEGSHRQQQR